MRDVERQGSGVKCKRNWYYCVWPRRYSDLLQRVMALAKELVQVTWRRLADPVGKPQAAGLTSCRLWDIIEHNERINMDNKTISNGRRCRENDHSHQYSNGRRWTQSTRDCRERYSRIIKNE